MHSFLVNVSSQDCMHGGYKKEFAICSEYRVISRRHMGVHGYKLLVSVLYIYNLNGSYFVLLLFFCPRCYLLRFFSFAFSIPTNRKTSNLSLQDAT